MTTWIARVRGEGWSAVDDEGTGVLAWGRATGPWRGEEIAASMLVAGLDWVEEGWEECGEWVRVAVNVAGRRECWVKLVAADARTYTRRDAPRGLLPVSNSNARNAG